MLSSSIPSRTPRFAASVAATGAIIYISRGAYWLGAAVALVIGLVVAYHAECLLSRVLLALRS